VHGSENFDRHSEPIPVISSRDDRQLIVQGALISTTIVIRRARLDDPRAFIATSYRWRAIGERARRGAVRRAHRASFPCAGRHQGWLNAGDLLLPNALLVFADIFQTFRRGSNADQVVSSHCSTTRPDRLADSAHGIRGQASLRCDTLPGLRSRTRATYISSGINLLAPQSVEPPAAVSILGCALRVILTWARIFFQHADLWVGLRPLSAFRKHEGQLSVIHAEAYSRRSTRRAARPPRGPTHERCRRRARLFFCAADARALRPVAHRLNCSSAPVIDY